MAGWHTAGNWTIPDLGIVTIGIVMIAVGFLLILSMAIFSASKGSGLKGKGGAVVIVGFIPITFGTDKQSTKLILILSIVLVSLLVILFFLPLLL